MVGKLQVDDDSSLEFDGWINHCNVGGGGGGGERRDSFAYPVVGILTPPDIPVNGVELSFPILFFLILF